MFDRDSIRGFSALITLMGVASSLGFSFNAPAFSQAISNNFSRWKSFCPIAIAK
jgi:hypothetical protein